MERSCAAKPSTWSMTTPRYSTEVFPHRRYDPQTPKMMCGRTSGKTNILHTTLQKHPDDRKQASRFRQGNITQ